MIIIQDSVPLEYSSQGVVYVSGTDVPLERVINCFKRGARTGEIVAKFPSLPLADVYAVIAYYLRHQPEVEAYLRERQRKGAIQISQSHKAHAFVARAA